MLAVPPSVITPEHETVTITECFACLPLLSPSVLRARLIVKTKSKSQSQVRSEAPTGHSWVSYQLFLSAFLPYLEGQMEGA